MRKLLCAGLVFLGLLGCKQDVTVTEVEVSGKQPGYTATLNWMGHWKARWGKEQMVKQMTREFELQHQYVKVNMQFPQDIFKSDSYTGRLADSAVKMIQTNKYTWDIIFLDVANYNNIARKLNDPQWGKKYLVNFEEFDWFKESHKSFVFENPQYRNFTGGQIIGPIIEGIYTALWYNKKVADKMGLSIKSEDMIFDDFKGYIKAGYEYNKTAAKKVTLISTEIQNNLPALFTNLIISELGAIDTVNIDLAKSKTALLKGLKAFEELSAYKPLEQVHGKETITLVDEKSLFTVFQTYAYNRWAKIDPSKSINLIPVELPGLSKPTTVYPGTYQSVWGVFKNSPNVENAIKAMQFICTNDVAEQWLSLTKNPTGLKSRLNSADLAQSNIERFITTLDKKYGKNIQNENLGKILFGRKNQGVPIPLDAVLKGEISAEQCYNNIIRNLR
jgi:hypothetical protein